MTILFTDKKHSWGVRPITFDFSGVTDPLPLERAIFESKDERPWLTVSEILTRTNSMDFTDENRHQNFYEIVEVMKTMETLHKMIELYRSGNSHISSQNTIDLTNEVKAIEILKLWVKFANRYHKLLGCNEKVELTDKLILKIARETKPTLFSMEDPKTRFYDDKKSVIIYLSPYEDNTKTLKEKKKSKKCIVGKNRIQKFLSVEAL